MTTLTEFLLARIAEDEAMARKVDQTADDQLARLGLSTVPPTPQGTERPTRYDSGLWQTESRGDPILEIDTARLLAECEAKRQIVAMVPVMEAVSAGGIDNFPATKELLAYPLRALAGIYAGHPDYDEAWRA